MTKWNSIDSRLKGASGMFWPAVRSGFLFLLLVVLTAACSGSQEQRTLQEQGAEMGTASAEEQAESLGMTATAFQLATEESQQAKETAVAELVAASTQVAQLTAERQAVIDKQATADVEATLEAESKATTQASSTAEAEYQEALTATAVSQAEATAEAVSVATETAAFAATATMEALPPTPVPTATPPPATAPPLPTATPAERVLGVGSGLFTLINTTSDRPVSVGNVPCPGFDGTIHEGQTVECEIPSGRHGFGVGGWGCMRSSPNNDIYDGMHVVITIFRIEGPCEWMFQYCLDGVCEDLMPSKPWNW